jgi:hypothetical protein
LKWLATQLAVQWLPLQATAVVSGGEPHALPQVPQSLTSFVRFASQPSASAPLQFPNPASHPVTTHVDALHADVAFARAHAWPHAPQLPGSEVSLTHAPPQLVRPVPHVTVQVPPEQTSPAPQTFVQVPQWFGSLPVATQAPLQRV